MISQTAIGNIKELQAKGLSPSPEDIIRINALGLKLEAARKKHAADSLSYLPRVAAITPEISFRQPTVGHEIWLEKVERVTAPTFETALAVRSFALSRPASDLPDPEDPAAVKLAVETFAEKFADLTREQIYAAIDYVIYGASPLVGEYALSNGRRDPDGSEPEDWSYCVALGVLNEGRAVLWGIDRKELESMTRRQLEDLIHRAYAFHNIEMESEEKQCLEDYYSTLDVIEERLKSASSADELARQNQKTI